MERITLPRGLRIEVVDNDNLTVPVGTKATLVFDCNTANPMVTIDGESMACCLPIDQCRIITDNFKKTFRPKSQ